MVEYIQDEKKNEKKKNILKWWYGNNWCGDVIG